MNTCKKCGTRAYSDEHDAYYCRTCNVWLEGQCSDPRCNYCPGRPERPLGNNQEETNVTEHQ